MLTPYINHVVVSDDSFKFIMLIKSIELISLNLLYPRSDNFNFLKNETSFIKDNMQKNVAAH